MKEIKVKTPAKINLTLEILDKRKDGFHNIQSIMHAISLYDFLTVKVKDSKETLIEISGNSNEIPYNQNNLVYKAASLFLENTAINNKKISINIEKNIPIAAGLAGGSTDAAGTFLALNNLFNNPLNTKELHDLCSKLGSDLNFCLNGGCALCTSRGEIIENLPATSLDISLIKPKNFGISAKEAYTKFSLLKDKSNPDATTKLKKLLFEGKFDKNLLYNSLEKAVINDYKELQYIKNKVPDSIMSGSGPTFFALKNEIKENFDENEFIIIENLKTIPSGIQII